MSFNAFRGDAEIMWKMIPLDPPLFLKLPLDGYKTYAAEYEERKKIEEDERKRKSAEEEKVIEENLKKKSIQEEIAETLRKIKEQEAADAKVQTNSDIFIL